MSILILHGSRRALIACALILSCALSVHAQNISQVNELSAWLLNGYNKYTRPVNNQSQSMTVNITMRLSLRDFDEVLSKMITGMLFAMAWVDESLKWSPSEENGITSIVMLQDSVLGKMSTGMVFAMAWVDESLKWSPSDENGISSLVMSQDSVWKPTLTLENPYTEPKELGDKNWVTVNVNSYGEVFWEPLAILDTTCSVDTTYYPFDIQTCNILLYTFGYNDNDIILNVMKPTLATSYYESHATWKVLSTSVISRLNGDKDDVVMEIMATIKLERRPDFVLVNFLVPILVLALLNPLVFLLPSDSGERLSFSITILLATSVFLTILADYIPRNAEPMSKCAYMLLVLYIISSSILLLVIVSLKIYFISETRPVTSAGKAFISLCSCVSMKKSKISVGADLEDNEKTVTSKNNDLDPICWRDVSVAFDKCCFAVVYLVIVCVIGLYLNILRNGQSG